jgi:hypothetical protein
MKRLFDAAIVAAALGALIIQPPASDAGVPAGWCGGGGYCTVAGHGTFPCDYTCFNDGCNFNITTSSCDSNCPDGECVLCIATSSPPYTGVTVNGTASSSGNSGTDVICVKDDVVGAGNGNDVINSKSGTDLVATGNGADTITTGTGDDTTYAGDGNDTVDTYSGADVAHGEGGNDYLIGSNSGETLYGGDGEDTIDAAGGADIIDGGTGRSVIFGGSGTDTITTSTGPTHGDLGSLICGGSYNDTINVSGYGHVCIDGGSGSDGCTYTQPAAACAGDNHDVGTAINCEAPLSPPTMRTDVDCGCP